MANRECVALSEILGSEVAVAVVRIGSSSAAVGTIPPSLQLMNASPKRQREFVAGRLAAAEVLRRLGASDTNVPVGERRAPLWPDGFVGSITHDEEDAFAAAARVGGVAGIGIDIEPVDRFSDRLAERIGNEREFELWRESQGTRIGHPGIALFSLKESVFKCLNASVGKYFDFRDVEVYRANATLRLRTTVGDPVLAELLLRLRCDVRELDSKVVSACILLGH